MLKLWQYTQHYGYTLIEIQQCLCEPLEPYDYMTGFAKTFHVAIYLPAFQEIPLQNIQSDKTSLTKGIGCSV